MKCTIKGLVIILYIRRVIRLQSRGGRNENRRCSKNFDLDLYEPEGLDDMGEELQCSGRGFINPWFRMLLPNDGQQGDGKSGRLCRSGRL
jgi:hypothetical protein